MDDFAAASGTLSGPGPDVSRVLPEVNAAVHEQGVGLLNVRVAGSRRPEVARFIAHDGRFGDNAWLHRERPETTAWQRKTFSEE